MTHQATITGAHLETIYRILLKRIAKGLTAERLSHLIGKEYNYIEQVESLKLPTYPHAELERIALVLEESNHKSFYACVHDETLLNVIIERLEDQNKLSHCYSSMHENEEKCQLFMVSETLFGDFDDAPQGDENLEIAKDAISLMVRAGYFFEAKMPLEIFHSINRFLTEPLDAFYIEIAMLSFCTDGENDRPLKKIENVIKGYQYETC